jgi:hypothetical protein
MDNASERRKEKRTEQKGTIMVSDETADYWVYVQLGNVSKNGLYFESEHSFRPGNKIQFRYDNPPYKPFPGDHPATVQWCRRLSKEKSLLSYGVGIKRI